MKKYRQDRELVYRANFALINLGIKVGAKRAIMRFNGCRIILDSMTEYKDNFLMQRCCTNVLRSLLSQDFVGLGNLFIAEGAQEILQYVVDSTHNENLKHHAQQAISMLAW